MSSLIDHAAREHGTREIVSRWADGSETRTDWAGIRHDAMRLRQALARMDLPPGARVATLAMNHGHHLAAFYGITGAGFVLHTINPRLFEDQLAFIATHADDKVLFYDAVFAPLVERLKPRWPTIERYVCLDNGEYAALIAAEDGSGEWAAGPERDPCHLCYTSGTTGDPKGVLYTHRSSMFHAISALQPALLAIDCRSVMLPVVPMFHAAAWGIPWSCAAVGSKMVMSAINDAADICELMRREKVTHSAGVPTVWLAMFQHQQQSGESLPALTQAIIGGAAAPESMVARLMESGIRVTHAWGMTETSPIGTTGAEPANWDDLSFAEQVQVQSLQGRVPFGVQIRCVDLDDRETELARDGTSAGALQVRGPWVVKRYYRDDRDAVGADGWFDTGDVGIIHPDGTLQLTDRTKDVIKSGGEWISSVALENAAASHPAVAEAAAIGIAHPKWDERPILVVVRHPHAQLSGQELRDFLSGKVAHWWLPDAVEFVEELPHGATGKVSKKDLRERFSDYVLGA